MSMSLGATQGDFTYSGEDFLLRFIAHDFEFCLV